MTSRGVSKSTRIDEAGSVLFNIIETEPHILKLFDVNGEYHFRQKTNIPEVVINEDFYLTKAKYIEDNPVRNKYVRETAHWVYSSANKEANLLELKSIFD